MSGQSPHRGRERRHVVSPCSFNSRYARFSAATVRGNCVCASACASRYASPTERRRRHSPDVAALVAHWCRVREWDASRRAALDQPRPAADWHAVPRRCRRLCGPRHAARHPRLRGSGVASVPRALRAPGKPRTSLVGRPDSQPVPKARGDMDREQGAPRVRGETSAASRSTRPAGPAATWSRGRVHQRPLAPPPPDDPPPKLLPDELEPPPELQLLPELDPPDEPSPPIVQPVPLVPAVLRHFNIAPLR